MDRNSIGSNFSDISRTNSLISSSSQASGWEPPFDKSLHLKDTSCNCCGSNFNIGSLKKICCKFCYRGVCVNCTTKQAVHPETQETIPICDNCFEKFISKGINQLERLRSEIYELSQRYEHEKRATIQEITLKTQLEKELEKIVAIEKAKESNILEKIQALKESNSKLEKEILMMELENNEKVSETHNIENKIKLIQEEAEYFKTKYQNQATIESLQQVFIQTKQEYENLQNELDTKEINYSKAEKLELEMQRDKLNEDLKKIETDIEELKKKISEFEQEEDFQNEHIEILQKTLSTFSLNKEASFVDLSNSKFAHEYSVLKNQINQKLETIDDLKRKIEKCESGASTEL